MLDEPTEGLDPLVQEKFFILLGETAARGRIVLLSGHLLPEVQRACGRVAIVRAGKLVVVRSASALWEERARRVRLVFADGQGARALGQAERWSPRRHGDEVSRRSGTRVPTAGPMGQAMPRLRRAAGQMLRRQCSRG